MSKEGHLGGELWTTPDRRIGKGSPYSTRDVAIILPELGFTKKDSVVQRIAELIFSAQEPDGRFRFAPKGTVFPCHTITAARALCSLGYAKDKRLKTTLAHLKEIQHTDGGWRCNKVKLGKDPKTDRSNPGTTLEALDVFRRTALCNSSDDLDAAAEYLLWHWEAREPMGPCYFGIGTLFMQTEFPFLRYNLFYYCYVLSFYEKARADRRFKDALDRLKEKVQDGGIVVENPNRGLAKLEFCRKGSTSEPATARY